MSGSNNKPYFFECPICLELVHKPVVLEGCGHLFCFWCVYKSMNRRAASRCPMCQKSYIHLPRICEQLQRLLESIAPDPEEYNARRASQVEEEEEEENNRLQTHFSQNNNNIDETCSRLNCSRKKTGANSDVYIIVSEELLLPQCKACSKLVYKPIALNCGHLFCKACVISRASSSSSCPTCGAARHPAPGPANFFPHTICLELDHYLETTFPAEYTKRANENVVKLQVSEIAEKPVPVLQQPVPLQQQPVLLQPVLQLEQQNLVSYNWGELQEDEEEFLLHNTVHRGVGCDGCGMMPILGRRFSCSDCDLVVADSDRSVNVVGYDLCASCHGLGIYLPGRFNQKHALQHRMVEKGNAKPWILLWSFS